MEIEYLIVGQGITGTWLSYYLQKAGKSFVVIDNNSAGAASKVAAGIINPVTGRRMVKAWMIDDLLPFIKEAYDTLGKESGISAISQKNIIDFFPTPQMMLAFQQRQMEDGLYLKNCDSKSFASFFNYPFGCGEIDPVYTVHLDVIIPSWKKRLIENNQYFEEEFQAGRLKVSDKIVYKEITAEKIIFCDGINSFHNNPWFGKLPFAPNKGEVLIIEAAELPSKNIFKKGMMLVPLPEKSLYWVGSNYLWDFENDQPTEGFYFTTQNLLKKWLKTPFKIVDHLAAVRPATLERRPFTGFHPLQKNVGILNGMGTKGCSLAPFFAKQMADHLIEKTPLSPEADIKRFERILTK